MRYGTALCLALLLGWLAPCRAQEVGRYDLVVVGGTPSGVTAAVAAARLGEKVLLLEHTAHLGGVISGGLTASDVGRATTIGGLSREFFDRVLEYYRRTYGPDSQQVKDCRTGYHPEPRIAERVFNEMVAEQGNITLRMRHRLASVRREGDRITEITVDDLAGGRQVRYSGAMFVDATYEGDLMAGARVAYRVGREGMKEYGEPHGLGYISRPGDPERGDNKVQAYNYRLCLTTNPDNMMLCPRPESYDPNDYPLLKAAVEKHGANMRFTPDLFNCVALPNGKVDANAGHSAGQTSDYVGANYDYPDGNWARREEIIREHRRYVQGLLYFVQNDPSMPEKLRADARRWGLARDEFLENENWPYHLYIREGRRMIGQYVFREQDATENRFKEDSVGLGSYPIDMHVVERRALGDGKVGLGGGLSIHGIKPYEIPYQVLVPKDVTNLFVTVCCSATNIGYATLRMEPVYMILGHAAGTAARLARTGKVSVQKVPVPELQRLLSDAKQILRANRLPVAGFTMDAPLPLKAGEPVRFRDTSTDDGAIVARAWDFDGNGTVDATGPEATFTFQLNKAYPVSLRVRDNDGDWSEPLVREVQVTGGAEDYPTMILDNEQAEFEGKWNGSASSDGYHGKDYRHDDHRDKGTKKARYTFKLPAPGRYDVAASYPWQVNRATNVPVTIRHREGEALVKMNQRRRNEGSFVHLGTFVFDKEAVVEFGTEGTDGYVIADAVRLIYVSPK